MVQAIGSMVNEKSNREIASELNISITSVKDIRRKYNANRSKADEVKIRSRTRIQLVRSERRRAIFGFDQNTNLKVFTNKERNALKYCLRRKKYKFLARGDTIAYYDQETIRTPTYEEKGIKLGLKFHPLETQCS